MRNGSEINHTALRVFVLYGVMWMLVACGGGADNESTATPTIAPPSATPLAGAQSTPLPTSEVTPASMMSLTIWWPEPLAPVDRPEVTRLIGEQIEAFDRAEDNLIDIEFRLKRYQDVGGIMATLRTASSVAPGVLPDLTLIRREELLAAVQSELVFPLERLILSATLGDLYDSAIALGQVDGQIYGLPYLVDVRHIAYRAALLADSLETPELIHDWSFAAVLERNKAWVFPARRTTGINATLYAQYIDAGGTQPDSAGTFVLNADAFRTVLTFYERAYEQGIVGAQVLEYATVNDYVADLTAGIVPAAVLDSTTYLRLIAEGEDLRSASLPTASGNSVSILNGWMWVLTTNNADQQEIASRFMGWMMDADRQRDYAATVYMLPSQRTALLSLDGERIDIDLMDDIMRNAIVPLVDNAGGVLPRLMQAALSAVLTGQSSADDAVASVVEQLGE